MGGKGYADLGNGGLECGTVEVVDSNNMRHGKLPQYDSDDVRSEAYVLHVLKLSCQGL